MALVGALSKKDPTSWRTHLVLMVAITTFHPGVVSVNEAVSHNEYPDRDCFLPKETGKIYWETVASMTTAPSLQRKYPSFGGRKIAGAVQALAESTGALKILSG